MWLMQRVQWSFLGVSALEINLALPLGTPDTAPVTLIVESG
jgi:hypothetical protein